MMGFSNSDIIEVKLFDKTYQIFYFGKARLKSKKEIDTLNEDLMAKGDVKIVYPSKGWFD
jgi:hypothetical protein